MRIAPADRPWIVHEINSVHREGTARGLMRLAVHLSPKAEAEIHQFFSHNDKSPGSIPILMRNQGEYGGGGSYSLLGVLGTQGALLLVRGNALGIVGILAPIALRSWRAVRGDRSKEVSWSVRLDCHFTLPFNFFRLEKSNRVSVGGFSKCGNSSW